MWNVLVDASKCVFVGEIRGFVGDFIRSSVLTRNWAFWLLQRFVD